MIVLRALLLLLLLLVTPALAQNDAAPTAGAPQGGVLTLPRATPPGALPPPPPPPRAAPVAPVQQVGPHAAKPKPRPTPVVQAPANPHAERPADPPPPAKPSAPSPAAVAAAADKGSITGLPLPRWVALRAEEVNLRVGPGTRFPIEWQYHRRDLPVEILREVEVWRLIVDQDGIKGWVHQATLVGHRSFVVKDAAATLRRAPADDAAAVALLKPGVVGRLRSCAAAAAWCEVQVGDYRGYLRRTAFFGTFDGEAVN